MPAAVSVTTKTDLTYPLLAWTKRLTPAQREADIQSDLEPFEFSAGPGGDPDSRVREDHLTGWWPVLPPEVPQCPVCKLPTPRARQCSRCNELMARYGHAVDTLELLTIVNKREPPETEMWHWKEETTKVEGRWIHPPELLRHIAPRLSAYVDAHAERLLADDPVLIAIPSRAPLIAAAFHVAAENGWYALNLVTSGNKLGDWYQHGSSSAERLTRTADDWQVSSEAVAGRPVVVFDDVFLSGASMFSYATALRAAGATEVRGVAIGRDVSYTHRDYYDAVRIVRRTQELPWSPHRANVYARSATDPPASR